MARLDYVINEKCCSVDGGRGIYPIFSFPSPGDLTAEEYPPLGICNPRKKNANAQGSAQEGRGGWFFRACSWN